MGVLLLPQTISDPQTQVTAREEVTNWLTMLRRCTRRPDGYTYAGIGDFLLRHGEWHEPQPCPAKVPRGMPRNCFHNALALASRRRRRGYRYVEGYAMPNIGLPLAVHHAWCLDGDGHLIDNTWEVPGLAYLGVPFSLDVARRALGRRGNTVLDNPEARHILFRNPFRCETRA
jgi:hypothetical protein